MHLRVERAQENAQHVARFLMQHPCVKSVFFPGKGGCDARSLAIHQSQCRGPGAVMSFTTDSVVFSRRFLNACKIFKTTVSFGSVNSLGEMPCSMSHASIPAEKRTLPADLVRLSVGIEDVVDLITDLERAFRVAAEDESPRPNGGFNSKFEDLPVVPSPHTPHDTPATTVPASASEKTDGSDTSSAIDGCMLPMAAADLDGEALACGGGLAAKSLAVQTATNMVVFAGGMALLAWGMRSMKRSLP